MSRSFVLTTLTAVMVIVGGQSLTAETSDPTEDTPTYNGAVGQLLLENCAACHRPNQIGPMSLLTYKDARRWARTIKAKVEGREMPPWFADPRFGHFANDLSLSEQDIATIVEWVDGGAPEGEGAPPEPPTFSDDGWTHPSGRDPDFIYELPIEWHTEADGESPNFNLFTPLPFDTEVLIEATEIRPGNFAATHHIVTNVMNVPAGMKIGTGPAWPGGPVVDYALVRDPDYEPDQDSDAGNSDLGPGGSLGAYIPGRGAVLTAEGQRLSIRGDQFNMVAWNLHYQATGQPESARPQIGIWFAKDDEGTTQEPPMVLQEYISKGVQLIAPPPLSAAERRAAAQGRQAGQNLNPLLDPIPANDGNWTVTGIGAVQNDSWIQSLLVHAHLRGKDFTFVLTRPDGTEEIMLRVPNYSFDWQFEYELSEPTFAPAGSTIKMIARYDNSRANRHNPAPHREVYWSEQSWDDMFLTTVQYTAAEGDNRPRTDGTR